MNNATKLASLGMAVHIPPDKVLHYLMSVSPKVDGKGKRAFFESFGFSRDNPAPLISGLRWHGLASPIAEYWHDEWGQHWECSGPMICPDGRVPVIKNGLDSTLWR